MSNASGVLEPKIKGCSLSPSIGTRNTPLAVDTVSAALSRSESMGELQTLPVMSESLFRACGTDELIKMEETNPRYQPLHLNLHHQKP